MTVAGSDDTAKPFLTLINAAQSTIQKACITTPFYEKDAHLYQ